MQLILTADVPNLGNMGTVVEVASGYGRNYLIPQKLAVQATRGNRTQVVHLKRQIDLHSAKLREEALTRRGALQGVSVTLARRTAATDKLYGSVTNRDIAEALAEVGHTIDRRLIQIDGQIKDLGIYKVAIRLHSDVKADVFVWVIKM